MKKLYFLILTFLISSISFGQVLLNENFDYGSSAGDITAVTTNWAGFSGSNQVEYITTSLSMTGYPSSGLGGSVTIDTSSQDVERSFSGVNSGIVYTSMLYSASNVSSGANGGYFYAFRESGSYRCRVYTKTDGAAGMVFGVRESDESSTVFGTTSFSLDTTYLIVLKYDFTAGQCSLFVLPSVVATEGAATAEATSDTGTNATVLNRVAFRQANGCPTANVDGIRVAITWNDIMNASMDPLIEVGAAISGLDYEISNGPSSTGSFTVEGSNLTADLVVSAPTNFEISESATGTFTASVTLSEGGTGAVAQTPIHARLVSGLASGASSTSYSGDATVSSTGGVSQTVGLEGAVFVTLTSAMTITGVMDPTVSSPRGMEIYIISAITDLSSFGLGSANNGNGGGDQEFTFPAVAAAAGDYIYVVGSGQADDFNTFFGNTLVAYESGAMSVNGDDAFEIFENGQTIDVFGDINTDGSGEAWEYTDGWAYRNTAGPKTTFTSAEWNYSNVGQLDGATNSASAAPFTIGTFATAVLSTDKFSRKELSIYPNPVNNGILNIKSSINELMTVSLFDILGKQITKQTMKANRLDVSNIKNGIYLMRVSQGSKTSIKKVVITN